jgi:hypothetical protein
VDVGSGALLGERKLEAATEAETPNCTGKAKTLLFSSRMQRAFATIVRRDQEKRARRHCRTSRRRFAAIAACPTMAPTPERRTTMPVFSNRSNRHCMRASGLCSLNVRITIGLPPNVQDEPRPWLARAVLLGARIVTAMVVGSGALFGVCRVHEKTHVKGFAEPRNIGTNLNVIFITRSTEAAQTRRKLYASTLSPYPGSAAEG